VAKVSLRKQQAQAVSSLGMKTAGGRVREAAARAFTTLESIERSAFYRLALERLRSAVIKASAARN
jgi:hypothetical protein